jgi:hypothetical protein
MEPWSFVINLPVCLRVLLQLVISQAALAAPLEVRVTVLADDRLPGLSAAQVGEVLRVAEKMLLRGCDQEVRFHVEDETPLREFLASERRRISPYARSKDSYIDIFHIDPAELESLALEGCEQYGTLDQLRNVFEPTDRETTTSYADAARLLVRKYQQRIVNVTRLKDVTGKPLITPEARHDFSLAHWEIYFASRPWSETRRLYLANTILVDDLRAVAPHSMVTGIANGVAYPAVNAAVVAYHPIFSGEASIRTHRFGQLTDEERLAGIAYVIAHEVGAHLIKGERDDYRNGARLARPIAAITDRQDILGYEKWGKRRVDPLPLDVEMIKWWMCDVRLDICIARRDSTGVFGILDAVASLKVDDQYKRSLHEKVRNAKWGE